MESARKETVRRALVDWRERTARRMGILPVHENHCARHSMVLHDIYIDAICEHAHMISSPEDLRNVLYYWKHLDTYGLDIYMAISGSLQRPKRPRCLSGSYTKRPDMRVHMSV